MEGCDLSVGGSFNSLDQYRRYFGNYYPDINKGAGGYQVPASWQSAIGIGGTLGNFIGIPWGAWMVDRYGYKKTLLLNYVIIMPFIGELDPTALGCIALNDSAIFVFAQNKGMLLAAGILCGIPFGVLSVKAVRWGVVILTESKLHPCLGVCFRGLSLDAETLPHGMDQLLLGDRPLPGERSDQRDPLHRWRLGVPSRVRHSMGLARPPLRKLTPAVMVLPLIWFR